MSAGKCSDLTSIYESKMDKSESVKREFDLAKLPIDLMREEQNENTATKSTLRKHYEIDVTSNIPKLSMK